MKKNLSDYVIAIAVILCSAVLLGALTYALSPRRAGTSDHIVQIDYPDVTGIKLHSEVRYAGAPAGTVTNIRLLTFAEREAAETPEQKRNAVRVTVTFYKEVPLIPSDVRASLSSETMLSEKFVALSAGTPEAPKLANAAILQGHSGGGIDGLFDAIQPITEALPHLLASVDEVLKGLNPLLKNVNSAVDTVKGGVNDIVPRADKLLDGFKTTSDSADAAIKKIDKLVENVDGPVKNDLQELKNTLLKMQITLNSANQLLGHTDKNLDTRMQELAVVLQNLKVVTTEAKAFTQALGERPNRLIFNGKPQKLTSEQEILQSSKPIPAVKP
jgi:ABC-type transporter Mla subunit MlaD